MNRLAPLGQSIKGEWNRDPTVVAGVRHEIRGAGMVLIDSRLVADGLRTSFVLLQATAVTGEVRDLLTGPGTGRVIVHREDATGNDAYHLLTIEDVLRRLSRAPEDVSIEEALDLDDSRVAPVVDELSDMAAVHDPSVVTRDGRVVGFVYPSLPVAPSVAVPEHPLPAPQTDPSRMGAPAPAPPGRGRGSLWSRVLRGGRRGFPGEMRSPSRRYRARPSGPPRRAGEADEAPPMQTRPTVVASVADVVFLGETVPLNVSIQDTLLASPGIVIADQPAGTELTVLVEARSGFVIDGETKGSIAVSAGAGTPPLEFQLKAVSVGVGLVHVLVFHSTQLLGRLAVRRRITRPPKNAIISPSQPVSARAAFGRITVHMPDLTIFIDEETTDKGMGYLIRLSASDSQLGLNLTPFGPVPLQSEAAAFFSDFYREIEGLPMKTDQERTEGLARIEAKGSWLFQNVLPPSLQQRIWDVRDQISSVIIQSEEPSIPWELCRLQGREGDAIVDGPFLAEGYRVTRWIPGIGTKPDLHISRIGLVVPRDSGLDMTRLERTFVSDLAQGSRTVEEIPSTYVDVKRALASGSFDCLHFSGHGAAADTANADRARIELEDGQALYPEDLSGSTMNLGRLRPLVFLNACQVGRSGLALTGIGGWARRFLEAQAAAFVGTYWSVGDEAAYDFATSFYNGLLGGSTLAEAVNVAREAARAIGDATWLAYTVYGDPLATVATNGEGP